MICQYRRKSASFRRWGRFGCWRDWRLLRECCWTSSPGQILYLMAWIWWPGTPLCCIWVKRCAPATRVTVVSIKRLKDLTFSKIDKNVQNAHWQLKEETTSVRQGKLSYGNLHFCEKIAEIDLPLIAIRRDWYRFSYLFFKL